MNALWNFGSCILVALTIAGCAQHSAAEPIVVTEASNPSQRESLVGKHVKLVGTVINSKIPTIMGVDVEMPSEPIAGSTGRTVIDLRGKKATAEGILRREVVTSVPEGAAHRGTGTFYWLADVKTGKMAVAQSAE